MEGFPECVLLVKYPSAVFEIDPMVLDGAPVFLLIPFEFRHGSVPERCSHYMKKFSRAREKHTIHNL